MVARGRLLVSTLEPSMPITEGCVDEGKCGDSRRVGTQDARAEGYGQRVGLGEQHLALAGIEASFRPDENRDGSRRQT